MKHTCCLQEQETPYCAFCGRCLCASPLDWLERYLVAAITASRQGLKMAEKAGATSQRLDGRKARIGERLEALKALRELRAAKEPKT